MFIFYILQKNDLFSNRSRTTLRLTHPAVQRVDGIFTLGVRRLKRKVKHYM